jgi:hypothetical protein
MPVVASGPTWSPQPAGCWSDLPISTSGWRQSAACWQPWPWGLAGWRWSASAYRQRSLPRGRAGLLVIAFYGLFFVMASLHAQQHMDAVLESSRLAQPERLMTRSEWLDAGWERLPRERSRIGPAELQRFDLQLAANLHTVARALDAAGWQTPPEPEQPLVSLLAARPDPLALPHFARDFAGRPENLIRVLPVGEEQVAVIRLWASGARLEADGSPIWLGQLRLDRIGSFLGIFNRWQDAGVEQPDRMQWLEPAFSDFDIVVTDARIWLIAEPEFSGLRNSVPEAD